MARGHRGVWLAPLGLVCAGAVGACGVPAEGGADGAWGESRLGLLPPAPGEGLRPVGALQASIDAGVGEATPARGRMPRMEVQRDPAGQTPIDLCRDVSCDDGQMCCHTTGFCYPADCLDCCYTVTDGPPEALLPVLRTYAGPTDGPALGGPEPRAPMPNSLPDPPEPEPNEGAR